MTASASWADRRAVVTGGSRGIGLVVARRLLAKGAVVHVIARPSMALDAAAAFGCRTHGFDICEIDRLRGALSEIEPDILVNNAGAVHRAGPIHELTTQAIDLQIDVNFRAQVHAICACAPAMVRRRYGHIVNIGSGAGETPLAGMGLYGATKAAMHFLGETMRYDLAGSGVRVTTISPGRVDTGIHAQATGGTPEAVRRQLYDGFRVLHADDVADAVMFALDAPAHVDVSFLSVMSTDQAPGGGRFETWTPAPDATL